MRADYLDHEQTVVLLTNSRFDGSSFILSRSLWWIAIPDGMGSFAASHTMRALGAQAFGPATSTKARASPPRSCLVRDRADPAGERCPGSLPAANLPFSYIMLTS